MRRCWAAAALCHVAAALVVPAPPRRAPHARSGVVDDRLAQLDKPRPATRGVLVRKDEVLVPERVELVHEVAVVGEDAATSDESDKLAIAALLAVTVWVEIKVVAAPPRRQRGWFVGRGGFVSLLRGDDPRRGRGVDATSGRPAHW